MTVRRPSLLVIIGPGILVAATGVGAGDLATGALAGSHVGLAVLWAVLAGAGMKFVLNEGLARWQLATGTTLLEGVTTHLGQYVRWVFLGYLLIWSYFVGSALINACGLTAAAICPLFGDDFDDKVFYGLCHSAAAVALVRLGGYRLFGRVMGVCIAVMFVVVVATAIAVAPPWNDIVLGLLRPTIPKTPEDLSWTVGLMGGVGGTVTVLCYGYWIREEGRHGSEAVRTCRIDLAVGYTMTAIFGIAMVVIGSTITVEAKGARLIVNLAGQLHDELGPTAKWAFLIGAWGAIFSSLLGVWQSVPYLFADFCRLSRREAKTAPEQPVDVNSRAYRFYLFALASVPAVGLWTAFETAQLLYAVVGALFIPMLALVLLILNGRSKIVGRKHRNSPLAVVLLVATLALFALAGCLTIRKKFEKKPPADARARQSAPANLGQLPYTGAVSASPSDA